MNIAESRENGLTPSTASLGDQCAINYLTIGTANTGCQIFRNRSNSQPEDCIKRLTETLQELIHTP